MKYAKIKYCDIANGPGIRTSVFVSGCRNACRGCFNTEAWDFDFGEDFSDEVQQAVIQSVSNRYASGITLLGGEPMDERNQEAVLGFIRRVRNTLPDTSIWLYTGFTLEQLFGLKTARVQCITPHTDEILALIDVLVDGPYIDEEHSIMLRFKGSRNQRIIDMKKSIRQKEIVLWTDVE